MGKEKYLDNSNYDFYSINLGKIKPFTDLTTFLILFQINLPAFTNSSYTLSFKYTSELGIFLLMYFPNFIVHVPALSLTFNNVPFNR